MKKNSGFTLLELIITVAVIAIVTVIAVPSMTTFTQNDRLTTNINTMIGHLAYARSEAVKSNQQVSLCVSSDAATNTPTCTGGNWEDGWIVYIDADANNSFGAGDTVLRAQQPMSGGNAVTSAIGTQITYDYRGFAATGSIGSLQLCDARTGPYGKTLTITTTGRVRLEAASTC